MYFDSHTHLNSPQLFKNYKKYIENFKNIGGEKLINVGVDYERTQRAIEIQNKFPEICYSTGGFHPTEPIFKYKNGKYEFYKDKLVSWNEYLKLAKDYLENLINEKKIIAIGECGIDWHYFDYLKEGQNIEEIKQQQRDLLKMQLNLAKKYNLPVVIHSRDAFEESIKILKNFKELKIYFHCWGYGASEIRQAQKEISNLWIGFDGNITYKKADNLRESIKSCNLEQILLETDAPYLTPQIIRKEINQPANVKYVYEYVGDLLEINIENLKEIIKNNFKKFYFDK